MLPIIQERLRKINSLIKTETLISLFISSFLIITFLSYLIFVEKYTNKPLIYKERSDLSMTQTSKNSNIFASKNGETYTFSWCQGTNKIKEENKIYFNSEKEALDSGRRLSKMCGK